MPDHFNNLMKAVNLLPRKKHTLTKFCTQLHGVHGSLKPCFHKAKNLWTTRLHGGLARALG